MAKPIIMSRACSSNCLGIKGKDLLEACKLAKQHQDALRIEAGIGRFLTDSQREIFQYVDEKLQKAIVAAEPPEEIENDTKES